MKNEKSAEAMHKKATNQQLNLARLAGTKKPCTINLVTENTIEDAVIFAFDTFTVSVLISNSRASEYRTQMIMKHAIVSIEEKVDEELATKLRTPRPREK